MDAFDELVGVVVRLRSDQGCPWDRAQSVHTLRTSLLEEAYEAVDAIDADEPQALKRELGDVLFLLLLITNIADEDGDFTIRDVCESATAKMIQRHPHVFDPNYTPTGTEGGKSDWEQRKAEQSDRPSRLDGVPTALPSTLRAHRLTAKASAVGFDWPDWRGVRHKVDEELAELDEAIELGDEAHIIEEFGDLLFTLVNLGRFLPASADDALRLATGKFERRFRIMEALLAADGRTLAHAHVETMEAYWNAAKEVTR